jgi:hypothetical protein
MVPPEILARRMEMILHVEFSPLGFEKVRACRWVESADRPIRKLFEFRSLKGASYSARWGYSLDFVPIRSNGKLRWKRTARAAEFDLCIDPLDTDDGPHDQYRLSRVIFPLKIHDWNRIARVVKRATRTAQEDFNRVNSIENIVGIFRERSAMVFKRFSLDNYVQTHIAWGLCLVALGKLDEAENHLQSYCSHQSVDRNDPILRQAEQEAIKAGSQRS